MEGGAILGTMNSVKVIEDCSEKKKITIAKAKVTVFYFLYLSQWDIQLNKGYRNWFLL